MSVSMLGAGAQEKAPVACMNCWLADDLCENLREACLLSGRGLLSLQTAD